MARLVRLEPTGPLKIEAANVPADKPLWICQCGLSQKYPFCDGAHKITRAEQPDMLYRYSADGKSVIEAKPDPGPDHGPGTGPGGVR